MALEIGARADKIKEAVKSSATFRNRSGRRESS